MLMPSTTLGPQQDPGFALDAPYRLALTRVNGMSVARLAQALETFGTAEALWKASDASLKAHLPPKAADALITARRTLDPQRTLEASTRISTVILHGDPRYPATLEGIASPPPVLYARGNFDLLHAPSVAVVGTRHASEYGLRAAAVFSDAFARAGLCVASGMARGIDQSAHEAALDARGPTIAVQGCGIDICYPREAGRLKQRIEENGLVLSQFPPGEPPLAGYFPARNRVVSGLSRAIVVIEAGEKSGALITAELAMEQDRPVFVVPGSIFRASNAGGHRLLTEGTAVLANTADDVLAELGIKPPPRPPERAPISDRDTEAIRAVLRRAAVDGMPLEVEEIARRSGIASSSAVRVLTRMELEGLVKRRPGNRYLL